MSSEGVDRYMRFRRYVEEYHRQFPRQWRGQAMFNALSEFDPQAAAEIRGTPLDPFLGSETVNDFLAWLRARWDAVL